MDKTALEALVRQVLLERLGGGTHGVKAVQVPRIAVTDGAPDGHGKSPGPGLHP